MKPPLLLRQLACGEQPAVALTHSSMSTSQFGPSYLHHNRAIMSCRNCRAASLQIVPVGAAGLQGRGNTVLLRGMQAWQGAPCALLAAHPGALAAVDWRIVGRPGALPTICYWPFQPAQGQPTGLKITQASALG